MKRRGESGLTQEELKQVFSSAGLLLSERQAEQFVQYYDQLLKWNRRANLISKSDEARVLQRHFLESAVLTQYEEVGNRAKVMDLGSGGGFPGLPMKIVRPDLTVTLLEARHRKALFLQSTVEKLGLADTQVVCDRAEGLAELPEFHGVFDVVVARAVAELAILCRWAAPLLQKCGVLIAVKGSRGEVEQAQLRRVFPRMPMIVKPLPLPQQGNKSKTVLCWPHNC